MAARTMQDDDLFHAIVKEYQFGSETNGEDGIPDQGRMAAAISTVRDLIQSFRLHHQFLGNVHSHNGFAVGDRVTIADEPFPRGMTEEATEFAGRCGMIKLFNHTHVWVSFPQQLLGGTELVRFPWHAVGSVAVRLLGDQMYEEAEN